MLCKFYHERKDENTGNQFYITLSVEKAFNKSVKQHHDNDVAQIRSDEENIFKDSGDQNFGEKYKNSSQEIFVMKLKYRFFHMQCV